MHKLVSVFVCVLLVCSLSVSVFASEIYEFRPDLGNEAYACSTYLPEGSYSIFLNGVHVTDCVIEYQYVPDDDTLSGDFLASVLYVGDDTVVSFVNAPQFPVTYCILQTDGAHRFDPDLIFTLSPISSESVLPGAVTDSLHVVLGWIGATLDSFFGPLLPLVGLMAVPIAVSALLFGIRVLRKSAWGV